MIKILLLACLGVAANTVQCPVCSVRGDPTSCTQALACQQSHDMCEMMLHLREENRIEFTCCNRPLIVCESAADVLLILDSSGSIERPNYALLANFSAELSKGFTIGTDKVQFGSIIFSSNVQNVFSFNTYSNNNDVAQALLSIPYLSATTNIADALDYARTNSFTAANGARPNVGKIAVVITDGNSNNPAQTVTAANALKASGVTTIAVGVGSNVAQGELQAIASSPTNVFNVNDFSVLDAIKKGLVQTACHAYEGKKDPKE